jgi:hypothetical protein
MDQCFELDTKGPCEKGQLFLYDEAAGGPRCRCKEKYVYWPPTNACYREYTPGPCKAAQFLVRGRDGEGVCLKNPCPKTDLYFPTTEAEPTEGECHRVGNRGPCPAGQLVIFEAFSGKSFRGDCGCNAGYNQNYWPEDGRCYEWGSQGPCRHNFVLRYNKEERRTECVCDAEGGYVFWNETGNCYKVGKISLPLYEYAYLGF